MSSAKSTSVQHVSEIFHRELIETTIMLNITDIGDDIKKKLERKIVSTCENRCIPEGYIRGNSVRVVSYSSGVLSGRFIRFKVEYECYVCRPIENTVIECVAKSITENAGIRAEVKLDNGAIPLTVFIPRDINISNPMFSKVGEGMKLHVRIIGVTFEINDTTIYAMANFICIVGGLPMVTESPIKPLPVSKRIVVEDDYESDDGEFGPNIPAGTKNT